MDLRLAESFPSSCGNGHGMARRLVSVDIHGDAESKAVVRADAAGDADGGVEHGRLAGEGDAAGVTRQGSSRGRGQMVSFPFFGRAKKEKVKT